MILRCPLARPASPVNLGRSLDKSCNPGRDSNPASARSAAYRMVSASTANSSSPTETARWDEAALSDRTGSLSDLTHLTVQGRTAMAESSITIGCDLGDKQSTLCVLGADGQLERPRAIYTTRERFRKFFNSWRPATIAGHTPMCERAWSSLELGRRFADSRNTERLSNPQQRTWLHIARPHHRPAPGYFRLRPEIQRTRILR
jgi:hypothetical protein